MAQGKKIYQGIIDDIQTKCQPAPGETLIYRGQNVDADWITPSLVRAIHFDQKSRAIDQKAIEKQKTFIEQAQAISQYSDLEALAHLRHYEAPSLLVDFTYDLHVALWFACLDVTEDVPKSELIMLPKKQDQHIALAVSKSESIPLTEKPAQHSKLFALKITPGSYIQGKSQSLDTIFSEFDEAPFKCWKATPHIDSRINHQKSVFVLPNRDHELKTDEIRTLFCFEIKQEEKQALREYVKMFCGITKKHIYPDVVGLANSQKQTFDIQSVIQPHDEDVSKAQKELLKAQEALLNNHSDCSKLKSTYVERKKELKNTYNERAHASLHVKAYQKAIDDCNEVFTLYPEDADSYCRLGVAYTEQEKYDEAIESFKRAIELYSKTDERTKCAVACYNLGCAYVEQEDYDEAIKSYKRAIELCSKTDERDKRAFACHNLGIAYAKLGKYDPAIAHFRKAIKLNGNCADFHHSLGVEYLKKWQSHEDMDNFRIIKNSLERAIELYRETDEQDKRAIACHNLGIAYLKKGDDDEAIGNLKRAIDLNSKNATAYYNLGVVYLNKKEYDKAIDNFNQAITFNSEDANSYHNLGCAYFMKDPQELNQAYCNYKQALALDPDFAHRYNIGEYYLYVNKREKALEHLTRAYQLRKQHHLPLDATLSDINNGLRKRGLKHLVLEDKEIRRIQGE